MEIKLNEYIKDIKNLLKTIRLQKDIEIVVGIARGGLFPATYFSYQLDLPLLVVYCNRHRGSNAKCSYNCLIPRDVKIVVEDAYVLLCDDIVDTGGTLSLIETELKKAGAKVSSVVLYKKKWYKGELDFIFAREVSNERLIFPYDLSVKDYDGR